MPDDRQQTIWQLVLNWVASDRSDENKAYLKERIRRVVFTRHAKVRKLSNNTKDLARKAQALLEPTDLVVRHGWLFEKQWVEPTLEDEEDDKFDLRKHEEKVAKARRTALSKIWSATGYEGVKRLCLAGEASWTIGWILADEILAIDTAQEFVNQLASDKEATLQLDSCLAGFLGKYDSGHRDALFANLAKLFWVKAPVARTNFFVC